MEYTGFKQEIFKLTGIDLNAYKENQMKRRIEAFIRKNQCEDYKSYMILLKTNKQALEDFLSYITINVSEFFRNPSQWKILEKEIIPGLLKKTGMIKIWSAACSSGDEPYSLAMLLSQYVPLNRIQITATDLDKEILKKAKEGVYADRHLTNIPKPLKEKFFTQVGQMYQISEELKKCIQFKQHNLLKDSYPPDLDLIVCRNVLIYFTEESKQEIYQKFSKSLKSEGVLFVGSTEQIIASAQYDLSPHQVFFYKKQ
ncbi:MAG: CheR family methyltransferase [Cellulosilyticaceae bacterium]